MRVRHYDDTQLLPLASENTSGCAKFDPGRSEDEQQVSELAESEHRTAEYQAERSADVTQQSQRRVGSFSLDVRVLQLRVEHLWQPSTGYLQWTIERNEL